MKCFATLLLTFTLLVSGFALQSFAQGRVLRMPGEGNPSASTELGPFDPAKAYSYHPHRSANLNAEQVQKLAASTGLPVFQNSVTAAQDNNSYTGIIVGRSPFLHGKIPVAIPTLVVPLKFEFLDANNNVVYTFDPDAPDACAGGNTDTKLVMNSPILNSANFTMNGVNVGNVQYVDGFQRANFWTLINGANYHTTLTPTLKPTITIQVTAGNWATGNGACSTLGGIEINAFDNYVDSTLLAEVGATSNSLPLFFTNNVVFYDTTPSNCCDLGYHGYTLDNPPLTYAVSEFETSGSFGSDVSDVIVMSHEVGEWMNDSFATTVANPTPPWGNIGQVSGCQSNLEVADPLTGTNFPPVFLNGFTYHLQEMAFFSWFYGGTSLGTGGKYSNNGTFSGSAKLCPPGGTN